MVRKQLKVILQTLFAGENETGKMLELFPSESQRRDGGGRTVPGCSLGQGTCLPVHGLPHGPRSSDTHPDEVIVVTETYEHCERGDRAELLTTRRILASLGRLCECRAPFALRFRHDIRLWS